MVIFSDVHLQIRGNYKLETEATGGCIRNHFMSKENALFLLVFENRILRRIFGPKRDENGEWRRLHNEELQSLYRSPNIVSVIKSR